MQSLFSAKSVAQVKKKNEKNYRQRAEQELWKRCKPTFRAPHHSSARRINILFFPLEFARRTSPEREGMLVIQPTDFRFTALKTCDNENVNNISIKRKKQTNKTKILKINSSFIPNTQLFLKYIV